MQLRKTLIALALAMPLGALAENQDDLIAKYTALAGSKQNATSLVTGLRETRLLGSRTRGGGHGPCCTILAISSWENSESWNAEAMRSVLPAARTSNTNSHLPGMWNMRPSARQRPGPVAFTAGA